uniref:SprT-like domain-containing protein n=1 Tax=Parascaris equorum TaxID=6256 RepID=A0A914RFF8_PAREQ
MCCYEGRGGLCSIRLSKPLLTFRSRKDLVETLLHEMIHAYLFVTVRDRFSVYFQRPTAWRSENSCTSLRSENFFGYSLHPFSPIANL